jgi:hypothetical protein
MPAASVRFSPFVYSFTGRTMACSVPSTYEPRRVAIERGTERQPPPSLRGLPKCFATKLVIGEDHNGLDLKVATVKLIESLAA